MSKGATLYRFRISLSDIERSVYTDLDFRVAMHPSETEIFLLTRVLAYVLNYEEGLEFSAGLSTPDEPAIRLLDANGVISRWIEIGNPAARRVHRASKACKSVRIYTYKDPENLLKELNGEDVHRAETIEIFSFESSFLSGLEGALDRNNEWTVVYNVGELSVTQGEESWTTPLGVHSLRATQ